MSADFLNYFTVGFQGNFINTCRRILHLTLNLFMQYLMKPASSSRANFSGIFACETSKFILPGMGPSNSLDLILMTAWYGKPHTHTHTHTTDLRPFFRDHRVRWCQKRTSGIYGAREDTPPIGWVPLNPD